MKRLWRSRAFAFKAMSSCLGYRWVQNGMSMSRFQIDIFTTFCLGEVHGRVSLVHSSSRDLRFRHLCIQQLQPCFLLVAHRKLNLTRIANQNRSPVRFGGNRDQTDVLAFSSRIMTSENISLIKCYLLLHKHCKDFRRSN